MHNLEFLSTSSPSKQKLELSFRTIKSNYQYIVGSILTRSSFQYFEALGRYSWVFRKALTQALGFKSFSVRCTKAETTTYP